MAFIVKAIGVPGDPLYLVAPGESGERTLSRSRVGAEVFTTRTEALNAIGWLRRTGLPPQVRPAVLIVVDTDKSTEGYRDTARLSC